MEKQSLSTSAQHVLNSNLVSCFCHVLSHNKFLGYLLKSLYLKCTYFFLNLGAGSISAQFRNVCRVAMDCMTGTGSRNLEKPVSFMELVVWAKTSALTQVILVGQAGCKGTVGTQKWLLFVLSVEHAAAARSPSVLSQHSRSAFGK